MSGGAAEAGAMMRAYWQAAAEHENPSLDEIRDSAGWSGLASPPPGVTFSPTGIGGVAGQLALPSASRDDIVLMCIHGGGFISGSSASHARMYGHLAAAAGATAVILDYPLAPESPFPAAADACVAAYRRITDAFVSHRVIIVGDSAGGNLAVRTSLRATSASLPSPVGIVLFSPWLDLGLSGRSIEANQTRDPFFRKERLEALASAYLPVGYDRKTPSASPLFGDLSSLPPLHIQVGADEALLDDGTRLAIALQALDLPSDLHVFPGGLHVFQATVGRDEMATRAIEMAATWIKQLIAPAAT